MSRGRKPGRPRGKGKRKRAPEPDPELAGILAEVPPGQEVLAPQVPMAQPTPLAHMLRDTPARRAAQGLRKNPPQSEGDRALRIEDPRGRFNWGRDNNRLKIGHLESRGRSHRRISMMMKTRMKGCNLEKGLHHPAHPRYVMHTRCTHRLREGR